MAVIRPALYPVRQESVCKAGYSAAWLGCRWCNLLPLAPALVAHDSGDAVFVPDAPYICSANPFGRQWFELTDPAAGLGRNASACLTADLIAELLDSVCAATGSACPGCLGRISQGMVALTGGLAYESTLCGLFCLSGAWLTPDQPFRNLTFCGIFGSWWGRSCGTGQLYDGLKLICVRQGSAANPVSETMAHGLIRKRWISWRHLS